INLDAVGRIGGILLVIDGAHEEVRWTTTRWRWPIEIGRENARVPNAGGGPGWDGGLEEAGRAAPQHVDEVEKVDAEIGKLVTRHRVAVRPHTELWIVGKFHRVERIQKPRPRRRIGRLRDRDAHMVGIRKLAQEPAVGEVIVDDD